MDTATSGFRFLSYSRVQLNFATALAAELTQSGIKVWFDLEQLKPGTNWREGINNGLENCTGLILIASEAALASVYVQLEWETVLAAGKPVYVVLFQAVKLPEALDSAPVFDLSVDFKAGCSRLLACLQNQSCESDPFPRLYPFAVPAKLPPDVQRFVMRLALLGLSILVPLALILLGADAELQQGFVHQPYVTITIAGIGAGFLLARWYYVRHRLAPRLYIGLIESAWMAGMVFGVIGVAALNYLASGWFLLIGLVVLLTRVGRTPVIAISDTTLRRILVVMCVVGVILPMTHVPVLRYLWMLLVLASLEWFAWFSTLARGLVKPRVKEEDLVRWIPPASGEPKSSSVAPESEWQPPRAGIPRLSCRLHYAPADRKLVEKLFIDVRYPTIVEADSDDVRCHVLLITRRTRQDDVKRFLALAQESRLLVSMLIANLPVTKRFPELERYQIVDYRIHDKRILDELAYFVRNSQSGMDYPYGGTMRPRNLNKAVHPRLETLFRMMTAPGAFIFLLFSPLFIYLTLFYVATAVKSLLTAVQQILSR